MKRYFYEEIVVENGKSKRGKLIVFDNKIKITAKLFKTWTKDGKKDLAAVFRKIKYTIMYLFGNYDIELPAMGLTGKIHKFYTRFY